MTDYPVALGRECNWCGGTPEKPNANSRDEPCPCKCHERGEANTEPLWRGPTAVPTHHLADVCRSVVVATTIAAPGTEVEVWPAGDRTSPTREQVYEAIAEAITEHVWVHGSGEISGDGIHKAADAVMALLHGQGDETDG